MKPIALNSDLSPSVLSQCGWGRWTMRTYNFFIDWNPVTLCSEALAASLSGVRRPWHGTPGEWE